MESERSIKRTIGLGTAVATMTGCIIGASVFIVPGTLSAASGPNAWISYIIGALLSLFSCFVYAQVGATFPVSGANYRLCSGGVNGNFGFIYVWCYFLGYLFLYPIMSRTAAAYLIVLFPELQQYSLWISIIIVVLTGLLNLLGTVISGKLQTILVILLCSVVLVFSICGISQADWSLFNPLFPKGFSPVIIGVLSTYYAFSGVNCIIDMSGDIINPGKNIPRTVFISMGIIIVMYMGVCITMPGIIPWNQLGADAPAVTVANRILPAWFGKLICVAAIAACWTTLNAVFGAMARILLVLGKAKILPHFFSEINKKNVPGNGISALTIIGSLMCVFYASIMQFVNISSFYVLLMALLVSIAFLRIKKRFPDEFAASPYRKEGFSFYLWPILTIISSIIFMIIEVVTDTTFALAAIALLPIGLLVYSLRRKKLLKNGISPDNIIMQDMYSKG